MLFKTNSLEEVQFSGGDLHLAIGMFDGVHLGHQAVVESAIHSAKRCAGQSAVLTFDPHPSCLFNPKSPKRLIMPLEHKGKFLQELGVDVVVSQHFDSEFAAITAEEFIPFLKKIWPQLKGIYVGENFCFGKGRKGDVSFLIESAKKVGVTVFSVPRILHNGEPISSTRIRKALEDGQIELANELLGFNYFAWGQVVSGDRRGRKMGYSTLNIPWQAQLRPKYGVYVVRLRFEGTNKWIDGVANFGVRPTVVDTTEPLLEVHLFEETTMGPGAEVTVLWYHFIRPEQKFDSVDLLKEQIGKDCSKAIEIFKQEAVEKGLPIPLLKP